MSYWVTLADLVLPADCGGCGMAGTAWCARCAGLVAANPPAPAAPDPVPAALPPVVSAGPYAGPLGAAVVAYKDRGRHGLARVLGDRLAAAVRRTLPPGAPGVLLVPVPATAAAARLRYGDHLTRLARRAAVVLDRSGVPAGVAYPLRARPRADSTHLSAAERHAAAGSAFAVRAGRLPAVRRAAATGLPVVLVDDVLTTGATLAAVAGLLRANGVTISGAAVVAATARRCR